MAQGGGDPKNNDDPINANLKRVYDDMLSQDVPDRFKDLLEQLKSQDNSSGNSDTGDTT
ncbi:NepR family anti-sigma factor [Pseudooctadecabacter sp.]|uniref:NepR family anti-sigma factor n=1 Tax=Pseudooctadecabacter sp. TaxID=1966338 RepID=UPI0025DEF11B|nr:NepR family anti-sigma factor [Pseudooctadecabacter sp.]